MDKIGFIGLGIMGRPMAKNLIKAGYAVVVCDVNQQAVEELRACGAESAATPAETAEKAGTFIVTMLPNSPQVREVTAGENGLLKGIRAGQIVVDMSSISPIASRELDALLREKGAEMLDAPVSGGQEKAEQGTLAIMVGGSAAAFEKACPILEKMGATVTLVGESGAGQITKLVNQMIVGINISAVAEGMAFAKKAGVEPRRVFEAIRKGLAGSQCLEDKAPRMFEGRYRLPYQPPHQRPLERPRDQPRRQLLRPSLGAGHRDDDRPRERGARDQGPRLARALLRKTQ